MENIGKQERIEYFDYIKAVCVFMVVVHHCIDNYITYYHGTSILSLLIVFCHTCHVPIFLIVSGYFCHEQSIKAYSLKKIKRILYPFVFFSVLKLIYSIFISTEFRHGGETIISQVYYSFFIGRQYWFIYTIFGIYILAPLFWTKACNEHSYGTVALITSYILICLLTIFNRAYGINIPEFFQFDHIIYYLPYFTFGCFLKQNEELCVWIYTKHRALILFISTFIIVSFLFIYEYFPRIRIHPIRFFVAISFFVILYNLTTSISKRERILMAISRYSLQIMFFDGIYRTIAFALTRRIGLEHTSLILVITCFVMGVSVLTCKVLEKNTIAKVLIGL